MIIFGKTSWFQWNPKLQSSLTNRRSIDNPKICPDTQKIVVPWSIKDSKCARALAMFTSSVTWASHSGSVAVQSYQCSLILITFCDLLNKISEIMGRIMKSKINVKIGFVSHLVANRRLFMEPVNADQWDITSALVGWERRSLKYFPLCLFL
jgi:hypothetical protein